MTDEMDCMDIATKLATLCCTTTSTEDIAIQELISHSLMDTIQDSMSCIIDEAKQDGKEVGGMEMPADRVGVADRDGVVEPTNSSGQAGLAKGSGKLAALKKRLAYRVPKSPDVASGGPVTADGEHGPSDDITGDNMVFSGDSSTSGLQLIADAVDTGMHLVVAAGSAVVSNLAIPGHGLAQREVTEEPDYQSSPFDLGYPTITVDGRRSRKLYRSIATLSAEQLDRVWYRSTTPWEIAISGRDIEAQLKRGGEFSIALFDGLMRLYQSLDDVVYGLQRKRWRCILPARFTDGVLRGILGHGFHKEVLHWATPELRLRACSAGNCSGAFWRKVELLHLGYGER
ncbi:hypothetical protein BRADI_3g58227v3 [Brachypodium distachyon]|uniref:Uncharacterized protein n=2 Tax=Brachypodium distachyon TaxID=15368 RepID=A0A0Q3INP1_BRADI|nr:hypothetical protein BRADI_3g58227v3 [Brachypodium distachyon]